MIDLIDRDALRSAIEDTDWYHVADNGKLVSGANSLKHTPLYKADDVFNAIFDAPSVSVSNWKWIPVTERMPEPFQPVIVCHKNGKGEHVVEVGFKREDFWRTWGSRIKNITHWMPLPEPPKVGMEGGDAV